MSGSRSHAMQERKNRRVGPKKVALSSRSSLASSLTVSSGGSSGSGSTVTQESLSRTRLRSAKEPRVEHGTDRLLWPSRPEAPMPPPGSSRGIKERINVWQFLANDQSRTSLVEQRAKKAGDARPPPVKVAVGDESDPDGGTRSLHSDSGVSLTYASSDHESPGATAQADHPKRSDGKDQSSTPKNRSWRASRKGNPYLQAANQDVDQEPENWYRRANGASTGSPVLPSSAPEASPLPKHGLDASGYDLLASGLCSPTSQGLPPLYRRFGRLNHRVLLQLQDEIAEMEEDLQQLDQVDAWHRTMHPEGPLPASRRLDRQWAGHELHGRKVEVLGRIYLKVEQYNQAIAAFQRVASVTSSPSATEIDQYRTWMDHHQPVVDGESLYVEQRDDLVKLSPHPSGNAITSISIHQLAILLTAFAVAATLPILVFQILPTFPSRIFLILLLYGPLVILVWPKRSQFEFFAHLAWRRFLAVHLAILLLAAMVV